MQLPCRFIDLLLTHPLDFSLLQVTLSVIQIVAIINVFLFFQHLFMQSQLLVQFSSL